VAYTGDESPAVLYAALVAAGTNKYVKLDLSGSSVGGFAAGIEAGRTRIVELTLPNSLTEIPSGTATAPTFQGFTRLTALHAPAVTTVGAYAFYSLGNLTMVSLPQADTIEFYGFGVCTNLTTVILGDTPPTIGLNIFNRLATSATTITIKVPGGKLTAYQSTIITSGKTWGDVTNKVNTDTGYFWDGFSTTRDKLTVNLESL
jgi:hypothetical protein